VRRATKCYAFFALTIALLCIITWPALEEMKDGEDSNRILVEPQTTPVETPPQGKIITSADDGTTITLRMQERFLLKLGEGYDWNVTIDDQTVLSRVVNVLVVRGAQRIYVAIKPGLVALTAVGDPVCRKPNQPCEAPSRMFKLYVVVVGAPTPKAQAFEMLSAISAVIVALLLKRKVKIKNFPPVVMFIFHRQ
jgi:hypothetical protein